MSGSPSAHSPAPRSDPPPQTILIVTGGRSYPYPVMVWMSLDLFLGEHGPFTLYHGDCRDIHGNPRGADFYAQQWANVYPQVGVLPFPADFDRWGRKAGPLRNRHMVATAYQTAGPDHVYGLAFPHGVSKGTRGCMKIMDGFRIPYRTWEAEDAARYLKEMRDDSA